MIQDLLALDANAEIFLNKTVEDCDFIGMCSAMLLDNLANNKQLIERDEQLHNLYEMEVRFSNVLFNILHGNIFFSVRNFPVIEPAIQALSEKSAARIAQIDGLMKEAPASSVESRVVSQDELAALLSNN
jgi:hypothetical protein